MAMLVITRWYFKGSYALGFWATILDIARDHVMAICFNWWYPSLLAELVEFTRVYGKHNRNYISYKAANIDYRYTQIKLQ